MENKLYDERLRNEAEAYFGKFNNHLTHACTFTFKQEIHGNPIAAEKAWEYWENYCKYLNRLIYKHAAKRHGKTLLILPVLEGEKNNKQLHFHCAIGCTDRQYSFKQLKRIIDFSWRNMKWTNNEIDIRPYRNKGWIGYMCKESTRLDLHNVDITRCFIPKELKAEILG